MPQTFREARWYRSMLYVHGHKLEWMLKAPKYGADALMFDLEDSVELSQKLELARRSRQLSRSYAPNASGAL